MSGSLTRTSVAFFVRFRYHFLCGKRLGSSSIFSLSWVRVYFHSVSMGPLLLLLLHLVPLASAGNDYGLALSKSILFFEAQRSGYLPSNQRVTWRGDSGLHDGKASGVDLVGGYYDAGDNVKFGLPMAFTITMMSWSIVEYGKQMAATGELSHAMEAVKWGTDYLIKTHPEPNVLYGEVGDGDSDHLCWQRPEDMTTDRRAYKIDTSNPGSDLAGETAAAMAAASLVFRQSNPAYANELLNHASQLFEFADKYRGKYDRSITVAEKYYSSFSGYADELLWAAAWLYQATNNENYLNYLAENGDSLGGTGWAMKEFGWDVKYAGVQVLVSKFLMQGKGAHFASMFAKYEQKAEFFMCSCLGKGTSNVQRTPGGLLFHQRWNNLQYVTTASFLLTVYSDYLSSVGSSLSCPSATVAPPELLALAKSQVDYILGDNPRATSYMVGHGSNFPQQVHHRGSSIISIKVDHSFVSCNGGYDQWYSRKASDPNLLMGAIVGGPDAYDNFADDRKNYEQTEPTTYNNAPLLGVLARLNSGNGGLNQLLPVSSPKPVGKSPNPTPQPKTSPATAKADSPVIIEQITTSWSAKGRTYYRYSAVVMNKSGKTVKDLKLSIAKLYGPLWGLSRSGGGYIFPSWLDSLPAGKSLEFVYIHAAAPADIRVTGYTVA
ncbi:Endoglucanase [Asimina triloba]